MKPYFVQDAAMIFHLFIKKIVGLLWVACSASSSLGIVPRASAAAFLSCQLCVLAGLVVGCSSLVDWEKTPPTPAALPLWGSVEGKTMFELALGCRLEKLYK